MESNNNLNWKKNYYFYADLKQGRMTYKLSYFMVMWSKSRDQIDRSTDVSLMNRIRKWNITEGIWLTRSSWENSRDMLRKSNFTTISYVLLRAGLRYGFLQWHSTLWWNWLGRYNLNLIISAGIHFSSRDVSACALKIIFESSKILIDVSSTKI